MSLRYDRARPHPVFSDAENQNCRDLQPPSQRSPLQPDWAQNPISVSPSCHGRFGPTATTGHWACAQHSSDRRYQLAVGTHPISPTRANSQKAGAASPSNPSQLAAICIWVGEGAWRQSRRVGELLRGHMSFSLLLSPLPRATFPSYDLCFPSLPVKKGGWQRRGGSPFRLAVLKWGWGRKSEWPLGEHLLGACH